MNIKELADLLGRTPGAVVLKMQNRGKFKETTKPDIETKKADIDSKKANIDEEKVNIGDAFTAKAENK